MRSLRAVIWLVGLLAITGLALMFLYLPENTRPAHASPTPAGATPAGFVRGLHFWAAQLVVLIAILHLTRVVFVKTNRRYAGWAIALLFLIVAFSFTGFLLPWDQLTQWLPNWAGGLLGVYWIHTLALSALLLPILAVYVRWTRRDLMLKQAA